jgi:hypothetical protein
MADLDPLSEKIGRIEANIETMAASLSKVNSNLALMINDGLPLCEERGQRMDRLQDQITSLRNGKAETNGKGWIEITKNSLKASGWPIILLAALAYVYLQTKTPAVNQDELVRKVTHAVVKNMQDKDRGITGELK